MSTLPFLAVKGDRLVDDQGRTVVLRGYNIGGWMNMENFLTGFPSTESRHRQAMRRGLGDALYTLYFDRFMDAFFSEDDARYMASLGLNHVRIPFNYRHFEDDARPFELKEAGFALLDRAIAICRGAGLYAILDMHALPGSQNQHWHSDNPAAWGLFWTHPHFQDRAIRLWEALADRYKDEPVVAGYNIMNEPGDSTGLAVKPFYDRAVAAVRAIDKRHVIFLDGNRYSTEFSMFEGAPLYENTVYSAHDYKLPGFAYGGPYPGVTNGIYVDRAHVEETFLKRTEFMRRTGTPIWIGEFGPVFPQDQPNHDQRYQLLKDQLEIYNSYGASWSIWAYKDVGGQGLVSAAPDSPWLSLVRPIIEKKKRLAVDTWGSDGSAVRDIMQPLEETFDREYPEFEPFPFGRKAWLATIVRAVVLAEPMLKDFEKLFTTVRDEETVVALAESFRFGNCVKRERLAALLAEAAAAPVERNAN